jgi:hypothetical protein
LPWSQWGAPNPDNVYERCVIDPGATYVLRGRVAGVHEALFSLVEGDMHEKSWAKRPGKACVGEQQTLSLSSSSLPLHISGSLCCGAPLH